jgi:hypothetical protein
MELALVLLDSIGPVPIALNWPEVIEGSMVAASEITSLPKYSSISQDEPLNCLIGGSDR